MSTGDSGRYAETCGATNRNGEPCGLPAGWGTPGSGGTRCKFHGGASTGPKDVSHLEGNSYAEGNVGGGAPKGNTNAEIHGGFADWRKAYDRFDEETRAYVARLIDSLRETATERAPHMDEDRRELLLKEWATLSVIRGRADLDVFSGFEDARGMVIEEEREIDGETYIVQKANPAVDASLRITGRKMQIGDELNLYRGSGE